MGETRGTLASREKHVSVVRVDSAESLLFEPAQELPRVRNEPVRDLTHLARAEVDGPGTSGLASRDERRQRLLRDARSQQPLRQNAKIVGLQFLQTRRSTM